jgi:hypothetical protein
VIRRRAPSLPLHSLAALLAALGLSSSACLRPTDAEDATAIPEGVAWVGFVPEHPGATGSVLRPYLADEPLVYPVDTERTWRAVGYPEALLETFATDAPSVRAAPLEWTEADACSQLPPPLWEARATEGPSPLGAAHMRAAWARGCARAPSWLPSGVDVRCPALPGCGARFARDACTVTFDPDTCGGRVFVAEVSRYGSACVEPMDGCARVPTETPGSARWACGACELEAHPVQPPRPLVVQARRLVTLRAEQLPDGQLVPDVQLRQLEQGGVAALALRGREVWVALRRSPMLSPRMCGNEESAYNDGAIVRLDQESLAELGTTTVAGRCLTRLVPDPLGPGMLATFYVDDVLHVGRYDAAGEPLAAEPLERRATPNDRVTRAVAMVVTSTRTTVVVEYFERSGQALDDGMIYVLDTLTLKTQRALFRDGPVRGVAWTPRQDAVVVVVANGVLGVSIPALEELSLARVPVLAQPLYPHVLADGRVLLSDPRLAQGVLEVDRSAGVRGVSRVSTYRAVVTDLLPMPRDREALAMLLTSADESRTVAGGLAWVSLDPTLGVRVEPETWAVVRESGEPIASALTQPTLDAQGRVWMLAPWTGEVLRLDTLPR